jgi:hypothetical protein
MSTCIIKHGIHIYTKVMHLSLDFVNYRYVDRVCMFSCLDSGPWRQDSSAPPLLLYNNSCQDLFFSFFCEGKGQDHIVSAHARK